MKVVLLGAGGMLAHDLRAAAPPTVELRSFMHAELDVRDHNALRETIRAHRPELIINAAAYTRVDDAESNSQTAFAVNGAAPEAIGRAALELGAAVVHFSTDYIFDGLAGRPYREDDEPNPLSAYGRSKLEGEVGLRKSGAAHLVIRTQWLFGLHGRSFPRSMWERATGGQRTKVVADQIGRPTYTTDLARVVWQLVALGATGTLHVANAGTATWHEVACRVFAAAAAADLLAPCSTKDYPTPARRPTAAVLDTGRFERLSGGPMPRWEDALARFMAEVMTTGARRTRAY